MAAFAPLQRKSTTSGASSVPKQSPSRRKQRGAQRFGSGPTPADLRGSPPGVPPTHHQVSLERIHDPIEREADAFANRVGADVGLANLADSISNDSARRGVGGASAQTLPPGTLTTLQSQLAVDLNEVRFHTDMGAGELASKLNARAFTVGRDVFFGRDEPRRQDGMRLLAHELAHVEQQARGVPRVQRAPLGELPTVEVAVVSGRRIVTVNGQLVAEGDVERLTVNARLEGERFDLVIIAQGPGEIVPAIGAEDALRGLAPEVHFTITNLPEDSGMLLGADSGFAGDGGFALVKPSGPTLGFAGEGQLVIEPIALREAQPPSVGAKPLRPTRPPVPRPAPVRSPVRQPAPPNPPPSEIDLGEVALAFGKTVGTGLLVIGIVGLAVGAEIITAGAATGLLIGLAATAGVGSYLTRREEIEAKGYDVSIPETAVIAAGDVVGVSQLIEGVTGERLATGVELSAEDRSRQLGEGAGGVVLLLTGSRAFRSSQSVGQSKLAGKVPGFRPKKPGGLEPLDATLPEPIGPSTRTTRGPVETAKRDALPAKNRIGFDLIVDEILAKGGDPEIALSRMPSRVLETRAEALADKFRDLSRRRSGLTGDPLDPALKQSTSLGDITLRFENKAPSADEVAQARELLKVEKGPIELFGDTPAGNDFPGIDGVIGKARRPLSLKESNPARPLPESLRGQAANALESAAAQGFTGVQVHILARGRTVAQLQAAWRAASDESARRIFSGNVVTRILIQGIDGVVTILPGRGLPGIVVAPSASNTGADGEPEELNTGNEP